MPASYHPATRPAPHPAEGGGKWLRGSSPLSKQEPVRDLGRNPLGCGSQPLRFSVCSVPGGVWGLNPAKEVPALNKLSVWVLGMG